MLPQPNKCAVDYGDRERVPILKPSNQLLFIKERERFVLNFSHLDKSRWSLFLPFRLHFLLSGATGSNPETT